MSVEDSPHPLPAGQPVGLAFAGGLHAVGAARLLERAYPPPSGVRAALGAPYRSQPSASRRARVCGPSASKPDRSSRYPAWRCWLLIKVSEPELQWFLSWQFRWSGRRNYTLRLLPGRVNGDFLLADDRYLIARQGERWPLLDHPPTVLTLRPQLSLALQSAR